ILEIMAGGTSSAHYRGKARNPPQKAWIDAPCRKPHHMNGHKNSESASKCTPATTSELNNLIQIISGTAFQIENIWSGSSSAEKYFAMLRASIDRAAKITAQLAEHAGGTNKKVMVHPELAALAKPRPLP